MQVSAGRLEEAFQRVSVVRQIGTLSNADDFGTTEQATIRGINVGIDVNQPLTRHTRHITERIQQRLTVVRHAIGVGGSRSQCTTGVSQIVNSFNRRARR